jgi:putative membrane protein
MQPLNQELFMNAFARCALLLMPLAAFGASSNPDSTFYHAAAEAGVSEVDAGQLAQQKSSDDRIKSFGAMMVKDHSAANDDLKSLASSKNVTLPAHASAMQMAAKAKLDVLSGQTFDKAYIKNQIQAHKDTLALLRKEISSGQDPDAKAFALKILPTVQSHLKAANDIAAAEGT